MPAGVSPLVSSGAEGAEAPVALPQPSEPNTQRAPLLSIKLHLPRPRRCLVSRSHLVECLQQAIEYPFTLISAPAGFGKTTLLAQWLAQSGLPVAPVAWLSLEPEDNDPVRFLTYLIAALQTVDCRLGTSALALLRTPKPSPLETVLALLTNDLMVDEAGKIALVLDDYHTITAEPIHRAVTYLLEHLPPQLHLVISTRVDPQLPLARLRARGELVELRAQNLRFSAEEVTHFLADTMGLVLEAAQVAQVAQLAARTEGWVAGLQLAALSLLGRSDVDQVLAGFSGSHRYLVDFLAQEVLGRQPEPMQRFLLETSLLERLCAPLCAAVTGSSEAQTLLEQAERDNLFLVPLDEQRQWYRYHALFAQFLQERLRQTAPEEMERLHQRAATWFEEQEWIAEAMQHALAGADYERAVRLVTQSARAFLILGQTATLRTWLQALPEDLVRARPRLCMILGHELSTAGEFEAADVWLRAAETRLRAGESGGADGADAEVADTEVREEEGGFRGTLQEVLALRAGNAALAGDLPHALELVHQAGDHLPSDNPLMRSLIAFDRSGAYYWSGDMVAAGPAVRDDVLLLTTHVAKWRYGSSWPGSERGQQRGCRRRLAVFRAARSGRCGLGADRTRRVAAHRADHTLEHQRTDAARLLPTGARSAGTRRCGGCPGAHRPGRPGHATQ